MDTQNEVVDFYRHELARALNEQSFGVSRSEITNFTENGAEATITLLEGQTINVVLSSAGYQVSTQGGHYETLDDLLAVTSPVYTTKRMETLMARLEGLVHQAQGEA
ncbi:hypothetical protein BGW80DRAFT_45331 [Lactifluus volemus]|nr:hypothetical protein BGW80DRAFT_45331 [Lactifluus volemus]